MLAFLDRIGIGSVLFVPLGAGPECLGFLVLTRVSDTPPWTATERDAALDVGRDLGRAVANARQLERERAVADRLRKLDSYRMEMVNTLGHELRTPLFSMTANLELLDVEALGDDDRRSVAAASRGAARMQAVIEDLLTMAQVADPEREFEPEAVDLRRVLFEVAEECHHAAEAKHQVCEMVTPDHPVLVPGLADELHRMLANLASNAIKYSGEGRRIVVRLAQADDEVSDLLRGRGDRHLGGGPAEPVPRVLPLHQPGRARASRDRAGPGDRGPHRPAALRPRRADLGPGQGHDGDRDAAGPPGRRHRGVISSVMKVLSGSSTYDPNGGHGTNPALA